MAPLSMRTEIRAIPPYNANASAWKAAIDLLCSDNVIVVPTDTVYGIMCRYNSLIAVQRLYHIKQRPQHKAVPILIGDQNQLPLVTRIPLPAPAEVLAKRFWPGPLTLILPAGDEVPNILISGGSTVGVRMPDHTALCNLMQHTGPLAATSANRSGGAEALTAQQALEKLDGLVPLILCDDATATRPSVPLASTIVDLSGHKPAILRPGPIADEVLDELHNYGDSLC